jgi:hypothetical protein
MPEIGPICPVYPRAESQFPNPLPSPRAEGVPASLSPQAENRERGETEARWNNAIVRHSMSSSETENSPSRKGQLAFAIAQGMSITAWAVKYDVPRRTATRWASEPKVRAAVEACRRRALDRAIGRQAKRVTWAADEIAVLAKGAVSESVKLAALKAIFSNMMAVSKFAGLADRVTELEKNLEEPTGNTGSPA